MTILVGYPVKRRVRAVLDLAAMLARSSGEDLVVCVVRPTPWNPGLAGADREYRDYLELSADEALADARDGLPSDVSATFDTVSARSPSSGLVETAGKYQATAIVVGSSDAGPFGHIALSSVADRLLHSSPVPVAIAPRGFRHDEGTVTRVTLAYTGTKASSVLLAVADSIAERFAVPLRLASFAVHLPPPATARFRAEAAAMTAEWVEEVRAAAQHALSVEPASGRAPGEVEVVIGRGESWKDAFDDVEWSAGDVLVVGSSESGPIEAVFLGSRATKIVRYSPVPVLAVPRAAARSLARDLSPG